MVAHLQTEPLSFQDSVELMVFTDSEGERTDGRGKENKHKDNFAFVKRDFTPCFQLKCLYKGILEGMKKGLYYLV